MTRVDFKPDIDGFEFANAWSFDQHDREAIEEIIKGVLPVDAKIINTHRHGSFSGDRSNCRSHLSADRNRDNNQAATYFHGIDDCLNMLTRYAEGSTGVGGMQ